ncbi:MAG: aminoglycoside phosphotransferase family protein, partial [Clostridia bacterium]|nr:aminoglycoside phosphotransferase family protein [Clostridia bacterium]
MNELAHILEQFGVTANALPYGNGHINRTYLVDSTPRVILQRINTDVFQHPRQVMENVMEVTSYLKERIRENGGDPSRETLTFLRTKGGLPYYEDSDGSYYRAYYFVEDVISLESADTPEEFAQAAHAFGKFQRMLSAFPAEKLHETIELFHDTENRYRQFEQALGEDRVGRAASVSGEIGFALSHKKYASLITDAIKEGSVPVRVTHNDTKLNNVLLDPVTKKGICVIDLDTVMPGSMLYDFGDALRFGASTASED